MPYVVTQSCCGDASCVVACPVNCIHPAPGEPGFLDSEMVYVDAAACVDCGACTTACPVDAIKPHTMLAESELPFITLAESYYAEHPHADRHPLAIVPKPDRYEGEAVRVVIVGAGPAAMYAADELLKHPGISVDVIDKLPTPHGLVRAGVAPDHQRTKAVAKLFDAIEHERGFGYLLNLEVGRDITHDDLRAHYHAVIYATGASSDRSLGIEGEEMPGSTSATSVVGWYNGHPDHQDAYVDLGGPRVVIVGNGNVALDVARVLTADPDALATTDIAAQALATLRGSKLEEVVVLGRRGPEHAAFTMPELLGLSTLDGVDVIVDNAGLPIPEDSPKTRLIAELSRRTPTPGRRRIVMRFHTAPLRVLGDGVVDGLEVARTSQTPDGLQMTDDRESIPTTMVLRSVGYRGVPVPGLPFDDATATVPHEQGRVEPGVYVTGWIKRGPRGFIGTNKTCAQETVASLVGDLRAGRLTEPEGTREQLVRLAQQARSELIDLDGWRTLDRIDRDRGRAEGRPRAKFTEPETMVAAVAAVGADAAR